MDPKRVSIVIPAYNEEGAIAEVVTELLKAFPESELIVINDCSTDKTKEKAEAAGAKVISHQRNRGYGAGLKTGTRNATRDYILFCDADGQHTAEDVGRLINEVDGFDMVVGARGQDSHQPLIRRPENLYYAGFANYLAGIKIPDLNSGL
ncbi:MAG: glycosyltransferase family 2 protein [Bdellovibrionota bacterium]